MAIGELAETVSVEAATPLVETRSPAVGQVIENERIEELPLNGRNADRADRAGRRRRPAAGAQRHEPSMQGGPAIAVAGGQAFGVAYLLDGATHNNPYDNLNLPLPFPDALQEFRVETSTTTANNGMHSGASVNVGDQVRHEPASRRSVRVRPQSPVQRDQPVQCDRSGTGERQGDGLSRNQYGGTLGGPIATDRVFFFGAYPGHAAARNTGGSLRFRADGRDAGGRLHAVRVRPVQRDWRRATCARPSSTTASIRALFSPAALKIAAAAAHDDRPVRTHHLQPQPSAGRSAVHRQGRHAAQPEPLDLRPLHVHRRQVDAAARSCSRTTSWSRARAGATTRHIRSRSATRWC